MTLTKTSKNGTLNLQILFDALVKISATWRLSTTVPGAKNKFSNHDFQMIFSIKCFTSFRHFNFLLFHPIHFKNALLNRLKTSSSSTTSFGNDMQPTLDSLFSTSYDARTFFDMHMTSRTPRSLWNCQDNFPTIWWPSYFKDIEQYVKTCHKCQIHATNKLHIPIMISAPTTLFTKVYIDIMLMPKAQGYCYIIAARDDLSGAAEGWKLK